MNTVPGRLAAVAAALLLSACTMIGAHDLEAMRGVDFGPRETIRFCVLRADDVSEDRARALIIAVDREFDRFGLDVEAVWIRPWRRPGFTVTAILGDVVVRPLRPPCDRLVALVGRHLGDTLWGVVLPEVLGAVETVTHTKGYVVATFASLGQIGLGPTEGAVHESYHFLGCGHGLVMGECYRSIAAIKDHARRNRAAGRDFFPGLTTDGRPINTRNDAESHLHRAFGVSQGPAP